MSDQTQRATFQLIGGPTVLIEIAGLRVLLDPTFDPPGDHPIGSRVLTKTEGPAVSLAEIGEIDLVLLSHDQHPDNLDDSGRKFVQTARQVLSTQTAADRLGGPVQGMRPWSHVDVPRRQGGPLRVTAVPAQHGPAGTEEISGPVIGFVLTCEDLPTTYLSGDNASLDIVQEVAVNHGPVEVAVINGGGALTALMDAYITFRSAQFAQAAAILRAPVVIPAHCEGWAFYTQGPDSVASAMRDAGLTDQLALLAPGETVVI